MMCMGEEELVDHLFIHCSTVRKVWNLFFFHLNVSWSFLNMVRDLFSKHWIKDLESVPKSFGAICLGLSWGMWKERNKRIFEDKFSL